jgi:hypothetical protein
LNAKYQVKQSPAHTQQAQPAIYLIATPVASGTAFADTPKSTLTTRTQGANTWLNELHT